MSNTVVSVLAVIVLIAVIGVLVASKIVTEPDRLASASMNDKATPVILSSVSLKSGRSYPKSGGWNAGDEVTIKGSGFTRHDNKIYSTDGHTDSFIINADSANGTEIIVVLPEGFRAPLGTALKIVNSNGVGANIPAGPRVNF